MLTCHCEEAMVECIFETESTWQSPLLACHSEACPERSEGTAATWESRITCKQPSDALRRLPHGALAPLALTYKLPPPLGLPVGLGVGRQLPGQVSVGAHDVKVGLVVLAQRVVDDPLPVRPLLEHARARSVNLQNFGLCLRHRDNSREFL